MSGSLISRERPIQPLTRSAARICAGPVVGILCAGIQFAAAQSVQMGTSATYAALSTAPGSSSAGGTTANDSATIRAQISLGDTITGAAAITTPQGALERPNLIGQLYDPTALQVEASPASVAEGSTRQLTATATLDDSSTLTPDPAGILWQTGDETLLPISPLGIATAGTVYQDESIIVSGDYLGVTDPDGFTLTILNINPDDFGDYAADGIDDDWQVGHFGAPPNPDAGPAEDPDADNRDNLFEFLSGFSPLDPRERFELTIMTVDPAAGTADLSLNLVIPDRTYTIKCSPDLVTPFSPIGTLPPVAGPENDKLVRDEGATTPTGFYTVEITRP